MARSHADRAMIEYVLPSQWACYVVSRRVKLYDGTLKRSLESAASLLFDYITKPWPSCKVARRTVAKVTRSSERMIDFRPEYYISSVESVVQGAILDSL